MNCAGVPAPWLVSGPRPFSAWAALVGGAARLPQPSHAPIARATSPPAGRRHRRDPLRRQARRGPPDQLARHCRRRRSRGRLFRISQVLSAAGRPPVVLTPIAAREPMLPSKLSGGGAKATVSAVIGEGMRAYTIGVTDIAGGGGHMLPGDRVDVVLTYDLSDLAGGNPCNTKRQARRRGPPGRPRSWAWTSTPTPPAPRPPIAHTATLEVSGPGRPEARPGGPGRRALARASPHWGGRNYAGAHGQRQRPWPRNGRARPRLTPARLAPHRRSSPSRPAGGARW
jgi:hypothetical protein